MKKEVTINYGAMATISQAQFENFKPSYHVSEKFILEEKDVLNYKKELERMKAFVNEQIASDVNRCKAEYIKKMYDSFRFYEKNGKLYPSVTTILDVDQKWDIKEEELRQYGSRGTIVHALIKEFAKTGKWIEPKDIPELKEDILIVEKGNLDLHWEECGYKEFFEKFKFEFKQHPGNIYDEKHVFAGDPDEVAIYEGKLSLIEIKTSTSLDSKRALKQAAAYASCIKGIEQLVIVHLNPTLKCGYSKPIVSLGINTYFESFLKDRASFKKRFGI